MSNNEIVLYVYKNININNFYRKVISDSTKSERDDLSQHIYLYLLEYNNVKLNMLYDNNLLNQFIMKIILNQRNYYRSYYNVYCKENLCSTIEQDIEYKDTYEESVEKNRKLDFIDNELKLNNKKLNIDENLRYEVYKIYISGKYTIKELAEKYGLVYLTVFKLIKETKKIIKIKYEQYVNTLNN